MKMQWDTLKPSNIASNRFLSIPFVFLVLCAIIWVLVQWTRREHPQEPPYIHPRIPFIGHLIGMIRYGAKYFEYIK